jgi:spoIIIJ-associated protein
MTTEREEVELAESKEAKAGEADAFDEQTGDPGGDATRDQAASDAGGPGSGEAPPEEADVPAAASEEGDEFDDELEDARDEVLDFLDGLLEAMGIEGEADADVVDDGVEAWIDGDDLGLLIGRRGQVLDALQELVRIAVQRRLMERVRISLDVAGYRQRRRLALEQRAEEMAHLAIEDGEVKLEAMSAFERKIVHETVARIEGVRSFSEGEEPRRCVVIEAES